MSALAVSEPDDDVSVDAVVEPLLKKELDHRALNDVPEARRQLLMQRLEKMRRADDVWHVRSALFEVISLTHGEQVARERLLVSRASVIGSRV